VSTERTTIEMTGEKSCRVVLCCCLVVVVMTVPGSRRLFLVSSFIPFDRRRTRARSLPS
jgi:hypothetical protein